MNFFLLSTLIKEQSKQRKTKECEKPLCICVAEISSVKYLTITSKSGRVPASSHKIALLPIFLPSTASPTEAPKTI